MTPWQRASLHKSKLGLRTLIVPLNVRPGVHCARHGGQYCFYQGETIHMAHKPWPLGLLGVLCQLAWSHVVYVTGIELTGEKRSALVLRDN
jgi:hypothetical protein